MKRRQTWYVKVKVPLALQARLGTHVVRTLQTRSLPEAQLKRHSAVASIKAELEALRTGAPVEAMKEALRWRHRLMEADDTEPLHPEYGITHRDEVRDRIQEEAEALEETQGPDIAGTFYRIATSNHPALKETLELWLPEASKTLTKQTARQYRADANRFLEWAERKRLVLVSDVTKRIAGGYTSEDFDTLTAKTINRHISTLSTWWRWMDKKGFVEVNPWQGQFLSTKGKRGTTKGVRRHYRPKEITKLLQGLPERPLGALFRLGLFTGARLDELCSL
jgi:hypothetical protein